MLSFVCLLRVGRVGTGLLLPDQPAGPLLLRLFAFGDIDVRAGHAVRHARGVAQGHADRTPATRGPSHLWHEWWSTHSAQPGITFTEIVMVENENWASSAWAGWARTYTYSPSYRWLEPAPIIPKTTRQTGHWNRHVRSSILVLYERRDAHSLRYRTW